MSRTPTPAPPATEPVGADPSMEDILASIRRILNEDEAPDGSADSAGPPVASAPATGAVTGAGSAGEDEDVLVLDEGMLVTPPTPPPAETVEPEAMPKPAPPVVAAKSVAAAPMQNEGLLAPESAAAAASSVSSLLRTLSNERGAQVFRGGPTIEDLVREEIRPMLKAWLDKQLPPLVERLVRQEIERLAGRAGI